jgi:hypothetical protein
MHAFPVVRKALVSALVAFALVAGALFVAAPKASAGLDQCSPNTVCVWEGSNFNGNFSWWPAWDTGCHNHASNPNIRSGFNRTGYWVRFGGHGSFAPNTGFQLTSGSITGLICWPV